MKVLVEMQEKEFADFLRFKEGKEKEQREFDIFRREAYKLKEAVMRAIDFNERSHYAELAGYEEAKKAIELAYQL